MKKGDTMKRRGIFACAVLGCALLLFTVSPVSARWDQMEVLKQDFDISVNPPRDQWYAEVEYNSIDNEFMVIWRSVAMVKPFPVLRFTAIRKHRDWAERSRSAGFRKILSVKKSWIEPAILFPSLSSRGR